MGKLIRWIQFLVRGLLRLPPIVGKSKRLCRGCGFRLVRRGPRLYCVECDGVEAEGGTE